MSAIEHPCLSADLRTFMAATFPLSTDNEARPLDGVWTPSTLFVVSQFTLFGADMRVASVNDGPITLVTVAGSTAVP